MAVITNPPTILESASNLSLIVGTVTDLGQNITHPNITDIMHSATTSWTLRMQQYVDMFEDYLPEFTLESDTGTDILRVIIYSSDGLGSKRLKLWHRSDGQIMFQLALADGTMLGYFDVRDYSSITSRIIRNSNTLIILFQIDYIAKCIVTSKSGSLSITDAGYIHLGVNSYRADSSSVSISMTRTGFSYKIDDGSVILSPTFIWTDGSGSYIAKEPIDNVYTLYFNEELNSNADWSKFLSINGHTYMFLPLNYYQPYNLIKID